MSLLTTEKTTDLTKGSIKKRLITFALPLLFTSLLQQLYNAVDLLFVGNMLPKQAYAAVGSSSILVVCIITFFNGMSVGSNVVISRAIGSQNKERVHRGVHTAMCMSLIAGVVFTAVSYPAVPLFLRLMNTAPEIMSNAISYLQIYILSLTSVIVFNMTAGMIRATGNSATPMWIQFFGGLVNVVGDALLLRFFPNVASVAWATMISQTFSAVLAVLYLMKNGKEYQLHLNKMRIHLPTLVKILKIGVPAGIQNLVMTFSNTIAQFHINGLGVDAVSAFTTYFKVELLIYNPIVAMGQATTTFVAQNAGAGEKERINKAVKTALSLGISISVVTAVLLLLFRHPVLSLFNKDPLVVKTAIHIISITFPFYWIYNIMETYACAIRGYGYSTPPMYIFIGNICFLRITLLYLFMYLNPTVTCIAVTYPITWITTSVCFMIYYRLLKKRV